MAYFAPPPSRAPVKIGGRAVHGLRRGLLTAALGAVAVWLIACGAPASDAPPPVDSPAAPEVSTSEAEPPDPQPTTSPSPTRATTPAPTSAPSPTATPEPARLRPADFDADRFAREIAADPPDAVRVSATAAVPADAGTISVVLASLTADALTHLRVEFESGEQRVVLEFIASGAQAYLRGETGTESIGWLRASTPAGAASPLEAVPGADIFDLTTLQRAWVAEVVAPCRGGLTCFVLRSDESPRDRLHIDVESYEPVLFTTAGADGGPPQEVSIDWNGAVAIEVPSDAVEVSSEDLGFALLGLLLSVAGLAEPAIAPAAVATPGPATLSVPAVPPATEPADAGKGRDRPFPFGQPLAAPDWQIDVLDVVRGDEAWALLEAASRFNDPAPANHDYVLVRLAATFTGADEVTISDLSFRITGRSGRADRTVPISTPEPGLRATLRTGGQTTGWIAFDVRADETDLMLIFEPGPTFDDESRRYAALEPGAGVTPDWAALPVATDVGVSRADPAPLEETVTTGAWEVRVVETLRGDAALASVRAANPLMDPPSDGIGFVAVRIQARNVSRDDLPKNVGGTSFRLTGNDGVLYSSPPLVDPAPRLDVELFPGGAGVGWLVFQSSLADSGLMLRFAQFSFSDDDVRYLALDADAGIPPRPEPLAAATDLGVAPAKPVPLADTARTDAFEIEVLEVVRGDAALRMARAANQFTDAPDAGMEYVQVRVRARNISNSEQFQSIDVSSFQTLGDLANVWEPPFIPQPEPSLAADLYPGGVAEGWITLQAGVDEPGLLVVYEPIFDFDRSSRRYFATG